jgi:hypothetical protein
LDAANGSVPVSISYRTTPIEYRSLRESIDRFIRRVCSGAMYASVPAMNSGGVRRLMLTRHTRGDSKKL